MNKQQKIKQLDYDIRFKDTQIGNCISIDEEIKKEFIQEKEELIKERDAILGANE